MPPLILSMAWNAWVKARLNWAGLAVVCVVVMLVQYAGSVPTAPASNFKHLALRHPLDRDIDVAAATDRQRFQALSARQFEHSRQSPATAMRQAYRPARILRWTPGGMDRRGKIENCGQEPP